MYGYGWAGFTRDPTAEMPVPAGSAATPSSSPGVGAEAVTRAQLEPFQCNVKGVENWGSRKDPTPPAAQTSCGPTAATPQRSSSAGAPPRLGLLTTDHAAPFQCSTSVSSSGPPS